MHSAISIARYISSTLSIVSVKRYIVSVGLATCGSIAMGLAQGADSTKAEILDELEVSSTLHRREMRTERVDRSVIERISAQSAAEVVSSQSNAQIKDYGGIGGVKTVDVRSMGSSHTAVFVDGAQVSTAQNGTVDLGRYSVHTMESVSVVETESSSMLMSARQAASAASILLEPRAPRFEGRKWTANGAVRGGSFGLIGANIGADWRITEHLTIGANCEAMRANGKYEYRYRRFTPDHQLAYDTTDVRQGGDIRSGQCDAFVAGKCGKSGEWKVTAFGFVSDRGIPGAVVRGVTWSGERQEDRQGYVSMKWKGMPTGWLTLQSIAKVNGEHTHYKNLDSRMLHTENTYIPKEQYGSLQALFVPLSWLTAAAAYDLSHESIAGDIAAQRLSHIATARVRVEPCRVITATIAATALSAMDEGRHRQRVCPSIGIVLSPLRRVKLDVAALWRKTYRLPSFCDLYYTDIGSADLRPESASMADLSISLLKKWRRTELQAKASAYSSRVEDKIIAYPKGQQFRWTMINLGSVDICGASCAADCRVDTQHGKAWARANYAWQKAIDVTDAEDSYYRDRIPFSPLHSFSISAGYEHQHFGLSYSTLYTGSRYMAQENVPHNLLQPWYTTDINLYGKCMAKEVELKLTVAVKNVFDQKYDVIPCYPMPGRNVLLTFAAKLS